MTLTLTGAGPPSGAVAPSFNPASVANLVLWYKADAGTGTTTDGVAVSTWTDQSASGFNATQATGTKQALYKTAIKNGNPALLFDAVDDGYTIPTLTLDGGTQSFYIFVACSAPNTGTKLAFQGNSNAHLNATSGNWRFEAAGVVVGTTAMAGNGVWAVLTGSKLAGGASGFRVNAVDRTTNAGVGCQFGSGLNVSAGTGSPPYTLPIDGYIGEILVYKVNTVSSPITAGNRDSIETYLMARWT